MYVLLGVDDVPLLASYHLYVVVGWENWCMLRNVLLVYEVGEEAQGRKRGLGLGSDGLGLFLPAFHIICSKYSHRRESRKIQPR